MTATTPKHLVFENGKKFEIWQKILSHVKCKSTVQGYTTEALRRVRHNFQNHLLPIGQIQNESFRDTVVLTNRIIFVVNVHEKEKQLSNIS